MPLSKFPALEILGNVTTAAADVLDAIVLPGCYKLPASYCDFAQTFGYGLLGDLLLIYIPLPRGFGDSLLGRNDTLTYVLKQGLENDRWKFGPDGSPEMVLNLRAFGTSKDGDILTWNIEEPSGPQEYAIYVVGPKLLAIWKAADDFYDFVARCLDQRVKSMLGPGASALPATFKPSVPKPL